MEALLYRYSRDNDLELKAGDRVVIPFGAFEVFVTGEATKSSFVKISGLTRLRQAVEPFLTTYSSIRAVNVVSPSGDTASYDLFRADRYGELSQDPFLRPGDRVVIGRLQRAVTVVGEVERPGIYQLLPGDGLVQLLEVYGGGLTDKADPTRLLLTRLLQAEDSAGERRNLSYASSRTFTLVNRDTILVRPEQDLLPVAFFEGAVNAAIASKDATVSLGIMNKYAYRFFPGETLSAAVRANEKNFSAEADLQFAYIVRSGSRTPIDLSRYLYDRSAKDDQPLVAGDQIVIPFRQYFITVGGAVKIPGRYPYVPDRDWTYYVGLAGGVDVDRNAGNERRVLDLSGKTRAPGSALQPEDSIILASNSFLYGLGQTSAILSTTVSIITLVLTVYKLAFPSSVP